MINIIIIFCILIIYIIQIYLIYFDKSEIITETFSKKLSKKETNNLQNNLQKNLEENLQEKLINKDLQDPIKISKNLEHRDIINERNDPNLIISNQNIENISETIDFDNPSPWNRIITNTIYDNQYQIYIENFDDNKFINWKKLISSLDYNINNNILNITSNNELFSLAIINLILSDFNNEITFKEIIDHNLINISLDKLNKLKVKNKIIKLILKNKKKSLYINKVNTDILNEKPLNFSFSNISGYNGYEYSKI